MSKEKIVAGLRAQMADGFPIVGSGAGTGISAKFAERGGADLIVIYNSGRYRMAGRGSIAGLLPYGDANQIVVEMAAEVLPVVEKVPVIAGVCGTDPFRQMPRFLKELKEIGFSGVQNFPTVGLFEGRIRANMEETGLGFDREIEMIGIASKMDLLTAPYVFNTDEAKEMARVGADIVVAHVGTTVSGTIGAKDVMSLDEAVSLVQSIHDAAVSINKDVIVLCHGGPIAGPEDTQYVLDNTKGVAGFFGASSMERLPVEIAITENTKRFKALKVS